MDQKMHFSNNGNGHEHRDGMIGGGADGNSNYQQQWNYAGGSGPGSGPAANNNSFFAGDPTAAFPFPGFMSMAMDSNAAGNEFDMFNGASMRDQGYISAPATPYMQQQQRQHLQHQVFQQQQQQQQQQSKGLADIASVAKSPPPPDLLSDKRAAVIASLKQRASLQGGVSAHPQSSPVQGHSQLQEFAGSVAGDSGATVQGNRVGSDGPAARRPPLVKSNTTPNQGSTANGTVAASPKMAGAGDVRVQTPQSEPRKVPHRRATDVDRLLAECKAAADSSASKKNGKVPTGPAVSMRRSNTDIPSRGEIRDDKDEIEEGEYNDDDDDDEKSGAANLDESVKIKTQENKDDDINAKGQSVVGNDSQKRQSQSQSQSQSQVQVPVPERRLYEPPKRTSTVDDSVPPVRPGHSITWHKHDNRNGAKPVVPTGPAALVQPRTPAPANRKPEFDHELLHVTPEQVEEMKEWLVLTGYHDDDYRRKTINRRRRLAALQADMAELMREEQEDRDAMITRVEPPRASFPPQSTPQPAAEKTPHAGPSFSGSSSSSKSKVVSLPQATSANAVPVMSKPRTEENNITKAELEHPADYLKSPTVGHKRGVPLHDEEELGGRPKMARTNTDNNNNNNRNHSGDQDIEMTDENAAAQHQTMHRDRELLLQQAQPEKGLAPSAMRGRGAGAYMDLENGGDDSGEGYTDYKYHHPPGSYRGRGRGRGRGFGFASRGGMRGGGAPHYNPPRASHQVSGNNGRLNLGFENTRFFLIKSISYGYVEDSQQEGTWATQLKNVGKLIEAYNTCENVILFFSVNQSKAFQGYARMECLPDNEKVPRPGWMDKLTWSCSAPFRIDWLNTTETRFNWVAHLKNKCHDDSTVFYGRDGQEIDQESGVELCFLLDDYSLPKMKNTTRFD